MRQSTLTDGFIIPEMGFHIYLENYPPQLYCVRSTGFCMYYLQDTIFSKQCILNDLKIRPSKIIVMNDKRC